jgi:hypothetical protein
MIAARMPWTISLTRRPVAHHARYERLPDLHPSSPLKQEEPLRVGIPILLLLIKLTA